MICIIPEIDKLLRIHCNADNLDDEELNGNKQ